MRDAARFLFGFTVALHRQSGALDTINHIRESGTDLGLVALAQPGSGRRLVAGARPPAGPRIMALSPFIAVARAAAEIPALVLAPELADPTPPDPRRCSPSTAIGGDAARGDKERRRHRHGDESGAELLVALPAAASVAALSARGRFRRHRPCPGRFRAASPSATSPSTRCSISASRSVR